MVDLKRSKQIRCINAKKLFASAEGKLRRPRDTQYLMGRNPDGSMQVSGTREAVLRDIQRRICSHWQWRATRACVRVQCQLTFASMTMRKTRFGKRPDFDVRPCSIEIGLGRRPTHQARPSRGDMEHLEGGSSRPTAARGRLGGNREAPTGNRGAVTQYDELDVPETSWALLSEYLDKLKALVAQAEKRYAQALTSLLITSTLAYSTRFARRLHDALANGRHRARAGIALGVPLELQSSKSEKKNQQMNHRSRPVLPSYFLCALVGLRKK